VSPFGELHAHDEGSASVGSEFLPRGHGAVLTEGRPVKTAADLDAVLDVERRADALVLEAIGDCYLVGGSVFAASPAREAPRVSDDPRLPLALRGLACLAAISSVASVTPGANLTIGEKGKNDGRRGD
jgi:hypothetical protein